MDERGWQMAAWGVAAVVAVVLGTRLLSGGGPESPPVTVGPPTMGARQARRVAPPTVYVHVAGAVRRPGLYRVEDDARVAAAVDRAGGPSRTGDLTGVNLAARVVDGQQIVVPSQAGARAGGPGADAPVSLGTATAEELERLDGIGPTLAERIVERRRALGGFRSPDQLDEVDGIGAKRLEALKEALAP